MTVTAIALSSCERKLDSLECPCVSGYECCALDNRCYRAGEGCGDGSSGAAGERESAAGSSSAESTSGTGGAPALSEGGAAGVSSQSNQGGFGNDAASGAGDEGDDGGDGGDESQAGASGNPGVSAGEFPRYCSSSGWCGANHTFIAAWGDRSLGLWVAANDRENYTTNSLSRWDGERWTNFDAARDSWGRVLAIGGSAADDVWFVGEDSGYARVEHWDGASFVMEHPEAAELRGVWGSAPDDVWAVGVQGYTLHFDGAAWSADSSPSFTNDLNAVWGSAADDVIAVGSNGVIARWNGMEWALAREGPGPELASVWGSGADDVWAVGAEATVLHFDGDAWSEREIALPELAEVEFVAVRGTSEDDVWLAERGGRLVHYDGEDFSVLATSAPAVEAITAASEGEAWAFGALAFSARCERTGCAESTPVTQEDLFATWGRAADDVWAVGANGTIVHFDGVTWQREPSPTAAELRALHGAGGRIWAVGDAVLRYENGGWSFESELETPPLHAVFALAEDDVWVAGEESALRHFDGERWSSFDAAGSIETFTALWGSAPDDVWAGGIGEFNLHYDGANWTKVTIQSGVHFEHQVLAGTSRDNVFSYGWYLDADVPSFGMGRWDGRQWTFSGGDYGLALTTFGKAAAWAVGPRDVWVVSGSPLGITEIYRLDASIWPESAGTDLPLHGVWGVSADDGWAVGAQGTLLQKEFSPTLLP